MASFNWNLKTAFLVPFESSKTFCFSIRGRKKEVLKIPPWEYCWKHLATTSCSPLHLKLKPTEIYLVHFSTLHRPLTFCDPAYLNTLRSTKHFPPHHCTQLHCSPYHCPTFCTPYLSSLTSFTRTTLIQRYVVHITVLLLSVVHITVLKLHFTQHNCTQQHCTPLKYTPSTVLWLPILHITVL